MARGRDRSKSAVGDQAVTVVLESETNLGGTGNVEFFSSHELNHLNLKSSAADAKANPIVAKENCGHLEISEKVLTQGPGRIGHYIRMPFQLHMHGTGVVAIFAIVLVCTLLLLFAFSSTLQLLLFWISRIEFL